MSQWCTLLIGGHPVKRLISWKYWRPDHKYPLIIMKLHTPTHLFPLSALLILGSRGQGHGILVIGNGLQTIKLDPCVKDISCIFKDQKGF